MDGSTANLWCYNEANIDLANISQELSNRLSTIGIERMAVHKVSMLKADSAGV